MEAPAQRATQVHISRKSVLVVDDSADTARMMKLLLTQEGFEVHTAYDGPQALASAKSHRPDFVLLDLKLPTMDGIQVAEELRRFEGLRETVIVAVSGHDHTRLPEPSPFDAHLTKPVDFDRLLRLLAEACARRDHERAPS